MILWFPSLFCSEVDQSTYWSSRRRRANLRPPHHRPQQNASVAAAPGSQKLGLAALPWAARGLSPAGPEIRRENPQGGRAQRAAVGLPCNGTLPVCPHPTVCAAVSAPSSPRNLPAASYPEKKGWLVAPLRSGRTPARSAEAAGSRPPGRGRRGWGWSPLPHFREGRSGVPEKARRPLSGQRRAALDSPGSPHTRSRGKHRPAWPAWGAHARGGALPGGAT